MRFAVAIGILASSTLPAPCSASENAASSRLARSERKDRMPTLLQEPQSGRAAALIKNTFKSRGKNKSPLFGRKQQHQASISNEGILKNILASQQQEEGTFECDPTLSNDADVGLLSCGMDKYCMASQTSDLGGFCVEESPIDFDRQRWLQGSNNPSSLSQYHCNSTSPKNSGENCTCDEFDLSTNVGTFSCFNANYCFDEYGCGDTCANVGLTYTTTAADEEGFTTASSEIILCYDFFSPYEQSFCFDVLNGCGVSLDGVTCTSCSVSDPCEWDCENVGMGSSSSTGTALTCPPYIEPPILHDCDTVPGTPAPAATPPTPAPALLFVCQICGEGMDITELDGIVSIPLQPDTTCAELKAGAEVGAVLELLCPSLLQFVTVPCRCMPTSQPSDNSESTSPSIAPEPNAADTPSPIPGDMPSKPSDSKSTLPSIAPEPNAEDTPSPIPVDGVSSLLSPTKSAMLLVGISMAMVAYFAG
jgi:hypothetical protein